MKKVWKRVPLWARNLLILLPFWFFLSQIGGEIWGKKAFCFIFLSFITLQLMLTLFLVLLSSVAIEFIIASKVLSEEKLKEIVQALSNSGA